MNLGRTRCTEETFLKPHAWQEIGKGYLERHFSSPAGDPNHVKGFESHGFQASLLTGGAGLLLRALPALLPSRLLCILCFSLMKSSFLLESFNYMRFWGISDKYRLPFYREDRLRAPELEGAVTPPDPWLSILATH